MTGKTPSVDSRIPRGPHADSSPFALARRPPSVPKRERPAEHLTAGHRSLGSSRSPVAYATLHGPVADSDERLQRHDPEDWVVRGDRLERLDGLMPVDGDVWAASRHAPDVPPDHRRPLLHRHLDERDRTHPAPPQGRATSRGTNVPDPVALAEHRDDVPLAPDVRHAEREPGDRSGTSTAYLERDPAPRQKAEAQRHVPEPRVPSGRRVAAPAHVHRPQPVVLLPAYNRTSRTSVPFHLVRLATAWEPGSLTRLRVLRLAILRGMPEVPARVT